MRDLLQLVTSGLVQGAVYGLVAVGFVTVYAVSGIINLAQGQFAAMAAFAAIDLVGRGWPLPAAGAVAAAAVVVLAVLVDRVTLAPAHGATGTRYLMITLGVLLTLQGASLLAWGPDSRGLPAFSAGTLRFAGVTLPAQDAWIAGTAVLVAAGLWAYFTRTTAGRAFQACAQQPVAARLVGISPTRMRVRSVALAALVAAVGGLVVSPVQLVGWDSGLTLGLKGFVAASLAGLLSVPGALLGGVLLGVVESLAAGYASSGLSEALAYVLLIALLVARPQGLLRVAAARA
jgi:branched-chain amino acid transport system permease protein